MPRRPVVPKILTGVCISIYGIQYRTIISWEISRPLPFTNTNIRHQVRAAKGGKPGMGRDGRNGKVGRGYRDRHGPGEQVKDGNTDSAGQVVEAGGMEACLYRQSNIGTMVGNWVGERCSSVSG